MIVKIIWVLIGINVIAWLYFILFFLADSAGRNTDTMEKGWTVILAGLGLLVILAAAVPLYFSQAPGSVITAGIFATLPLVVAGGIYLSNRVSNSRYDKTLAETYYEDKTQRSIAAAIEQSDTAALRELMKGQDVNIQGTRVWGWEGLNYLQFAIRVRNTPHIYPFNEQANTAAIRLLLEHGAKATPALGEAAKCLSPETLSILLDAGADPNTRGYASSAPVLFESIGPSSREIDVTMLLIAKGADVNATPETYYGVTPLMFAANSAQTSANWKDTWRLVRYLLEKANADYTYTTPTGSNLAGIIRGIRQKAKAEQVNMPRDFQEVVKWLNQHHLDTEPVAE